MSPPSLLTVWSEVLLESLAAAGVRDAVLSPGSRSTPFVLAACRCERLRLHDVIDERAAAFYALGQARASGRPSLLICTSGTAPAHYLPAVIEAGLSGLPLVILSADRPFELQGCAAPQTVDQIKLFAGHARGYFELGLPDESEGALRALRRLAAQAVHTARWPQAGAVHLNARARKPLEPVADDESADARALRARAQAVLARPISAAIAPRRCPPATSMAAIAEAIAEADGDGWLVLGPGPAARAGVAGGLFALAERAGFVVLCEAPSQLRLGAAPSGVLTADAFDLILQAPRLREALAPRLILQVGAPPTSSAYEAFLLEQRPRRIILGAQGWEDPQSSAEVLMQGDLDAILDDLMPRLQTTKIGAKGPLWRRAEALCWEAIDATLAEAPDGEAAAVRAVVAAQPAGATLVLGNSLPLREVDRYCRRGNDLRVLCQRGANGIDGLLAGAAGAASQSAAPLTLLVGDISLLHDLTSLALFQDPCAPRTIVVLNNGGGQIFAQLPIGAAAGADLAHFTTPHGRSFGAAAELFGLRYAAATSQRELSAALALAQEGGPATLLEVVIPSESAARTKARLWARLGPLLETLTPGP